MDSIGKRVAAYRRKRGFPTPAALAAAIPDGAVTRSTIINIEAGRKKDPSIGDLLGIARGLQISPVLLLIDVTEPFAPAAGLFPGDWAELTASEVFDLFAVRFQPRLRDEPGEVEEETKLVLETLSAFGMAIGFAEQAEKLRSDPDREDDEHLAWLERRSEAEWGLARALYRTAAVSGIRLPDEEVIAAKVRSRLERVNGSSS